MVLQAPVRHWSACGQAKTVQSFITKFYSTAERNRDTLLNLDTRTHR